MKKLFTILTVFVTLFSLRAQDLNSNQESGSERKNDIILDPILLIAVPMVNVSYERLINKDMGIGVNAMVTLSDEVDDFKQFSPYFRYYMGKKYASGFFFEGFVPVTLQNDAYYSYQYDDFTNSLLLHQQCKKKYNNCRDRIRVSVENGSLKIVLVIEASGGIARRFGDFDNYDIGACYRKNYGRYRISILIF